MTPARLGAAALLVLLCACSSGPAARTTSRGVVRSVPPPASTAHLSALAPASTPAPSVDRSDPTTRRAAAALLTPSDLPAGFSVTPFVETPLPQPCLPPTTRPVLQQYPPASHVGQQLTLASPPAILTEQIEIFASATDALQVEQAVVGGLRCTTGHITAGGTVQPVDVVGPQDLRALINVPVASLLSWTLQTGQLFESVAVARSGRVVTVLSSLFPLTADTAKLPDGRAVAQRALTKVLSARLG